MTCLVLFIMMENPKPVLAKAGRIGKRIKALEDRVKALEETCLDKCKRSYTPLKGKLKML